MDYLGNYPLDAMVHVFFTTHNSAGAAVAPSAPFDAGDILIYKNNSATQKVTTNGVTVVSPFDAITGLHQVSIDTSNDTGDAGFWVSGADYTVVLSPNETVDGQTVVRALAQFSSENRYMRGTDNAALASVVGTLTDTAAAGDPTTTDTAMQYLKQLVNVLVGTAGIATYPPEAAPGNAVSLAEVIRAIHADVTGLNGAAMRGTDGANTVTPPTTSAIAGAVWDEAKAGHVGVGSFGEEVQGHALSSEISALNDVSTADVLAQVNAALDTAIVELAQGKPTATPTIRTGLMLLYMALRNRLDVSTSGTPDILGIYNNAGTLIAKKQLTDAGGDYSEAQMETGP